MWEKGAGEEEGTKEGGEDVIVVCPKGPSAGQVILKLYVSFSKETYKRDDILLVCPKGPSAGQVMRRKKRGREREREKKRYKYTCVCV